MERVFSPATKEKNLRVDVGATLDSLKSRADVRPGPVATTGYCVGGNASFRVATLFGDQIALAASFHGGSVATTQANSPHLKAGEVKARVYFAGALEDPSFTDDMKTMLETALAKAAVLHTIETYPAKHGFCVSDSPSYDRAAAERHHVTLTQLLKETFGA